MKTVGPAWLTGKKRLRDPHGRGERAVRFLNNLTHHEGKLAGQPFKLASWQERIVRRVYGDTDDAGRRRVRTVFVLLPRSNGKTTLGAGLSLLHLLGPEKEAAGQVVAAASDREQASIAYNAARRMVENDTTLDRITRRTPSNKTIRHNKSDSTFKAISHEAYTKHGLSISFLLADELHAWPPGELWDVLTTSMGKREEPLTVVITTAGNGTENIAYELYDYARKVDRGDVEDPTFLPVLFEPPKDFDWQDEKVWKAVNPALADGFRSEAELREKADRAKHVPRLRQTFRQLYLNEWQSGGGAPWLDMDVYDQGGGRLDTRDFEGRACWVGVDLSSTEDLTAIAAVFPEGEGYSALCWFFLPEETVRRRTLRENINYQAWVDEGWIEATPGAVVDLEIVEQRIMEIGERFDVQELPFDRWGATGTMNRLMAEGLPVVRFGQGFKDMSPAVKAMQRAILAGQFYHGDNPVLRWNVANAQVDMDPAENVKLNKARSADKIDGAVACAMAIGRAECRDEDPSPYMSQTREAGFLALEDL
jgi:phage terminase large subunit-like protein